MAVALRGGPKMQQVWMGWGLVRDVEDRESGGESEAGARQFGIWVLDEDGGNAMDNTTDVSVAESHEMTQYPIQS